MVSTCDTNGGGVQKTKGYLQRFPSLGFLEGWFRFEGFGVFYSYKTSMRIPKRVQPGFYKDSVRIPCLLRVKV